MTTKCTTGEIWKLFKSEYVKTNYSPLYFKSYIETSSVSYFDEKNIVILCKNVYSKRFLQENYDKISEIFTKIVGSEVSLYFAEEADLNDILKKIGAFDQKEEKIAKKSTENNKKFETFLLSNYTFETFVKTNSNTQAFSVAQSIAKNPGEYYNPVFIYGNSGLGKTHLMQAIGNEILKNFPDKKVLYVQTDTFTTEYISAIQTNKMDDFREKYRNVDVLLVDDIQFIANKPGTQEEFFNTFNVLSMEKKSQIVITSDCKACEIKELAERLKTRFENGFTACISPPDYEDRFAIMEKKSESMNIELDKKVMDQLAMSEIKNVREIEGILMQFKMKLSEDGNVSTITMSDAFDALRHLNISEVKEINTNVILDVVSRCFQVTTEDIVSKNKSKKIVLARNITMYFCREFLKYSYTKIADDFNFHHTSVSDGCKSVVNKYHTDEEVKGYVDEIRQMLQATN